MTGKRNSKAFSVPRTSGGQRISNDPPGTGTKTPLISVITIVRNDRDHVESTMRSVLSQSAADFEYIVIDGASTDGTLDVIKAYADHIDYWLSEPDNGISDAFNKGLALSRGAWILFLNSADTLSDPGILSRMSAHVDKARIITGFASTGNTLIPKRRLRNEESLPVRSMISHQASMVHDSIFRTYGAFDTRYAIRMDYDFWLRVLRRERFFFMDDILVKFSKGGLSGRARKRYLMEELIANARNLGMLHVLSLSRIRFYLERYFETASSRS